ncbi:Putative transmembrane protein (PGPGW) [Nitrosomonas cryotolerans]|uniref:Putative transmembrane protein (PGPGW) n=2 Tax=Nitrosomonas cryotolerans TaxID=44575 RepID=A0A1N6J436_9PROT|nr:PGPGW domain-containing protein [Nitrosomonas cryotolerans]SFQ09814.1 Putative transmembrane protein (PGPGW) [Nitrosomonas cryotolerans]SIO39037.1 Putative transmembrane protein (PGPGW) [Nitrosomonas cryotolerans ATCC 49181]
MGDLLAIIQQWVPIDNNTLIGLTLISIISFIGSLIVIPLILIYISTDYFDTRVPRHWMKNHHLVLRIIGLMIKNIMGILFIVTGFIMIFLPGQGLLTILIGISLLNFPGKRVIEARIIREPRILRTINAIRYKFAKPPLILPPYP